jgi:hypothetical protein
MGATSRKEKTRVHNARVFSIVEVPPPHLPLTQSGKVGQSDVAFVSNMYLI